MAKATIYKEGRFTVFDNGKGFQISIAPPHTESYDTILGDTISFYLPEEYEEYSINDEVDEDFRKLVNKIYMPFMSEE